jgi:predicted DNA-binding protein
METISIICSKETRDKLKEESKKSGVKMYVIVDEAIRKYFEKEAKNDISMR